MDSRLIGEDVEVRFTLTISGVVRASQWTHCLAARLGQASDVSIVDRLAGSQTGSVRELPLSRRTVSDDAGIVYDRLRRHFTSSRASKDYLLILQYAALHPKPVDAILERLLRAGELPTLEAVEALLQLSDPAAGADVHIDEVELSAYDHLLDGEEEVVPC